MRGILRYHFYTLVTKDVKVQNHIVYFIFYYIYLDVCACVCVYIHVYEHIKIRGCSNILFVI